MGENRPSRSGCGVAILAGLAVSGSAIGVMLWQLSQKEKLTGDAVGFDISRAQDSSRGDAGGQPLAQKDPSGLSLLQPGSLKGQVRFDPDAPRPNGPDAAGQKDASVKGFTEAVRRSEDKARALAMEYTRRHPAIWQYGLDWMKQPDLKKLNDDYMRDHDPVKFLHGLTRSQNFSKLTAKYAADPSVRAFVMDVVKKAPGDVTAAAYDLLSQDGMLRVLLAQTAKTMGLPSSVTDAFLGGGKVDGGQVMGKALQNNPELQKAIEDPEVQKDLPPQPDPETDR